MKYLDVVNFEAYVSGCAGSSGVSVVWDKPDSTPRTDGKTMWLPAITTKTSAEWLTRMRYFVKHETSHVVYSDFVYLNKVKPTGILALVNNLIEDHRIDYLNDSVYKGDIVISNNFWELYTSDITKRIESEDEELCNEQLLLLPIFVWDSSIRNWIGTAAETCEAMRASLDADGVVRLAKLDKYIEELLVTRESGNAEDVMSLAERIIKDLYDVEPEDYKGKTSAKGGKGTASKGEGEEEAEKGLSSDGVDRLITCSKLLAAIGHEHTASRTGVHLTPSPIGRGAYQMPKTTDYVVIKFPDLHASVRVHTSTYNNKSKVLDYITSNGKPMANKLRMKLQTASKDRYEYGMKKGKLHNGSLHRVLQGDTPSASRVFRQRKVSDTLDTAVSLLVDCSGSMSGNKFEMACAGAGALAEALRPLNITFNVLGFTNTSDREEKPIVWVFNDFGERVSTVELVDRFHRASACLWENSDGDGIAYAAHALSVRKEHRKVLLVLSDGSPQGREWAGDIQAYTKQVVSNVESSGIDVYGIGICDSNVSRFYKKNVVVDNLTSLSPTILSIIERSI